MAWTVDIDGNSITSYCQSINWHPRWSRPATCVVRFPGHLAQVSVGSELHLYNNGSLVFSGPVWTVDPQGGPNRTDTEVTAFDHMIYFPKRLCKQGPLDPDPFNTVVIWPTIESWITAPGIMAAFVESAIEDPNADNSAPFPISIGSVDHSGPDVTGVPTNVPMTLDQMRQLLLNTGQLALQVSPGIGSSTINFLRPPDSVGGASATYDYQTGSYNAQSGSMTDDMDEMVNALWYLLGPRGPRPGIRINHWAGSITPTAANAGGDGAGQGLPGTPWPPALVAKFQGSRAQYGYMQEIRIYDDHEDEQSIREMFEEMWANEAWVRATPRKFVNVRPERGVSPTFGVGDFVAMNAGSKLNGGTSGTLLVFEFEVEINVNGIVAITEIIASADGSGSPGAP